jgi:hypothetical protein
MPQLPRNHRAITPNLSKTSVNPADLGRDKFLRQFSSPDVCRKCAMGAAYFLGYLDVAASSRAQAHT